MKPLLRYLLLLLLLIGSSSFGFARRSTTFSSIPLQIVTKYSDERSCVIPFNRVGNLMVIQARIDTLQGNFILDTGAPDLVLNLTYFRNYEINNESDAEEVGIGGGSAFRKTYIKELQMGEFRYPKRETNLSNLGAIENAKGIKILGLLGIELFKDCEMIIDFEQSLIYLHRIDRKETDTYKHALLNNEHQYYTFPFTLVDNHIIVSSELVGKKVNLIVDCAAESNILDSRLPDKVFEQVTINRKVKLTGTGDKKIDALLGTMSRFRMGNYEVADIAVTITNLEKTCFSHNGCVDGVLGFNFLSLHKLGFNFVNRKMYIWK